MTNQTRLHFKPTPLVKGWAVTGNACNASNEQAKSDNGAVKESWEIASVKGACNSCLGRSVSWIVHCRQQLPRILRENGRERIVTIFGVNWNRELVKDIIYKLIRKSICCDTKTCHMTKESIKIKLRILFFLGILKRK